MKILIKTTQEIEDFFLYNGTICEGYMKCDFWIKKSEKDGYCELVYDSNLPNNVKEMVGITQSPKINS